MTEKNAGWQQWCDSVANQISKKLWLKACNSMAATSRYAAEYYYQQGLFDSPWDKKIHAWRVGWRRRAEFMHVTKITRMPRRPASNWHESIIVMCKDGENAWRYWLRPKWTKWAENVAKNNNARKMARV